MNDYITAADLAQVGLTPRRIDHWTRNGWLRADTNTPGTGKHRRWPVSELRIAKLMVRMADAGLEPEVASRAARGLGPDGRVSLGDGIVLEITVEATN